MLAILNLGGGEVVLILALVVILYGAKQLPRLKQGLDRGAQDAGKAVGGIYGKPAAQALTPDNQTAELYDPAAFHRRSHKRGALRKLIQWCRLICFSIVTLVESRVLNTFRRFGKRE